MTEKRLEILQKIEQGELSVEEGFRLISELERAEPLAQEVDSSMQSIDVAQSEQESRPLEVNVVESLPDFSGWKIWSWVGFAVFLLLTASSAVWMIQGWLAHPYGWVFWLSWFPFLIGIGGMALMFNTKWLHIRIRQSPGEKPERIAISMPFPIGIARWAVTTFPNLIPEKSHGVDIGMILDGLDQGITKDQPLVIQVDDEDGEHVEVYIG